MKNHPVPVNGSTTSPFDAIKNTTTDGQDYWSARDLMPMLGYDRWENFSAAIDRAKIAAEVQGHSVENLFRGVTKKGSGRPQQDYELARFACYLVAMNGDPRKPEIASAMAYFAIRTREAETTKSPAELSRKEILTMALEAEERAEIEAARADMAEKRADSLHEWKRATEAGDGLKLTDFRAKYFTSVPQMTFFEHLYVKRWIKDERGARRSLVGKKKPGPNHQQPLRKANDFLYRHEQGTYGDKKRLQTRVKPTNEIGFRDALIREGLPPNTHSTGLVLISDEQLKAIL
ncbi:BRO family protein [Corynebacterium sanguinis]|uniref:BRO family protein n=1 Tax=Corynebacterium sanguinis TaxID=2594913 RepID=UPI0021A5284D|nr:BRO family protein [Corynebacterium sanguinis]MCT1411687.1 hypothetical protein [Corynebacterium sanguinis]